MSRHASPESLLVISLILITSSWVLGLFLELPFYYWWFDVALHTAGGLWAAVCVATIARREHVSHGRTGASMTLFFAIVGGAMLVGVLWEFTEFFLDRFVIGSGFTYFSGVLEDTMSDLLFDLVGATIGYSLVSKKRNHA